MRFVGILIALVGCGPAATQPPPDASGDGSMNSAGMFVTWRADPALPGPITDKRDVTEVRFSVSQFQVLGDAVVDEHTTRTKYELAWGDGSTRPAQESFPDAPAGMYSSITIDLNRTTDHEYAYEIRGVVREPQAQTFTIRDTARLTIALGCEKVLVGGRATTFAIELDLKNAISGLDFRNFTEDDGELELKSGPELTRFRDRLRAGFKVED